MKFVRIFLCFLVVGAVSAQGNLIRAQEQGAQSAELTLSQSVQKVVEHFPQLKSEEYALLAAKASQSEARSGYLPRLGLDASAVKSDDPVTVFSSLLKQNQFTSANFETSTLNQPSALTNYQTALELSLPVFTGFQNEGRVRSAGLAVKASQSSKENYEQQAILTAISTYIQILSLDKTLSLVNRTITLGEEAIKEADNLKEKGMVLGCDYLTARAILSQMKQMREKILAQQEAVRGSLNILMGTDINSTFSLQRLTPPEDFPAFDRKALLKDSLELRKDREAAQYHLSLAESELERERKDWLPKVDAFARAETNTHNFDENGNNYTVGMRMHMDIFEPPFSSRVERSSAEAKRYRALVDQIDDAISDTLVQALAEYESQKKIIPLNRQSVTDAQQAAGSIGELYKAGKRTIADLLKAQAYKLELENSYWNSRYNTYLGYVKLFFLSGRLDEMAVKDLEKILLHDTVEANL
ncbi:MAG TPA: TolC family protein [Candidatus Omnitrophota bacterium]|nr:TolC family protein [Candidatus Omnitrophota bacterium]HPD85408.1 TolC family protein [Candidatus Omnitrophota bacterium]HRZ04091.1 TolC family protein [Candidatus Omnitrophota bacterium]